MHSKFKTFTGKSIKKVVKQANEFLAEGEVTPNSIGVEYVDSLGTHVLSLGFTDEKAKNSHNVSVDRVLTFSKLGAGTRKRIDHAMGKLAEEKQGVICHDIVIELDKDSPDEALWVVSLT